MSMVERVARALYPTIANAADFNALGFESFDDVESDDPWKEHAYTAARAAIAAMRLDPSEQSVSCSTDFVDAVRIAWMEWEIVPHDFKRANAAAVDSWNAGIDAALGKEDS